MLGLSENNISLLITCLTIVIVIAITHGKGVKIKSDNNELAITSDKDDSTDITDIIDNKDINEKK